MSSSRFVKPAVFMILIAALAIGGYVARGVFMSRTAATEESTAQPEGNSSTDKIIVGDQAQKNLGLTAKPLQAGVFWKTITIQGMIVDRPGFSDREVVAPADRNRQPTLPRPRRHGPAGRQAVHAQAGQRVAATDADRPVQDEPEHQAGRGAAGAAGRWRSSDRPGPRHRGRKRDRAAGSGGPRPTGKNCSIAACRPTTSTAWPMAGW